MGRGRNVKQKNLRDLDLIKEEEEPVDFAIRGDYILGHFNGIVKMTSGHKIQRVVTILTLFLLPIIYGPKMEGYPPPETAYSGKVNLGSSLRHRGEFYKAITAFDEALQIASKLDDGRSQLDCLMQLGVLHWNIGEVSESTLFYRKALSLSQKLGQKDLEAECAAYIKIYETYIQGKKACAAGLYKESIAHFSTAIGMARKMKSPEHELKCLRQMSLNYYQQKDHLNFHSINSRALDVARRLKHRKEEGRCLNNIGVYFHEVGNYSRALIFYDDAVLILRETIDSEADLSASLNNIGTVYRVLGDYEKALPYIKNALEIDNIINDAEGISIELDNLAVTYRHKGLCAGSINDIHVSLEYHIKSLEISRRIGDKRSEIGTLNNIGLTYSALGNHVLALKHFRLALKEAELIGYIYEACNIYDNMGYVLFKTGKLLEAEACYKKALNLALITRRDDVLWEVYYGLGQCFEKKENNENALAYYKKAIDIIGLMRARVALDNYKIAFTRDKLKAYEALVNLLFCQYKTKIASRLDTEIFWVIEKARARSFLEELGEVAKNLWEPNYSEYRKEYESLSNKISITISRLTKPGLDETQRKKLLIRLEAEEEEYTNLRNRMRTQKLEDTRCVFPEIESIERIREQCLDKKTAILEYYLGERQSIGIYLDKNQLVLEALPPRTEIENSLKAYLKMLSTPPEGKFMGIQAAGRIYRELILPFEDHISPLIEHLIVIPDGILYYLPFETLNKTDTRTEKPQYLIELYDVSYAPSVSSLAYLMGKERPRKHSRALLAVGDPVYLTKGVKKRGAKHDEVLREIFLKDGFEFSPLPHSRKEIRRVSRCFPKEEVDILLDSQAKEESIKNRSLAEYQIIHFACHGFLDEKKPMRSALVLTLDDDVEEDGFLQAREISDLNLSADLVVLSACQTGKGKLENAEGVLGLPRTFFYAGARSTISSLWKISDKSTSEIMPTFYRYLTAGKNKATALRLAKLEMLRSSRSHPFYWAAFVLNGDFN
jgi:CHAT domain-containing protein/Tfp pilus assembly protein PilF